MAYFDTMNNDDDEENQGSEQVLSSGQGSTLGGQAGSTVQAGSGGGENKATKSGNWTNLTSYVDANKGADEAMGAKVKGTFEDTSMQAKEKGTGFKSSAESTIAANTIQDTTSKQLAEDPMKVKADEFARQYKASWAGPNAASEASGYEDVNKIYDQQKKKAEQVQDFSGRQALLSDVYKNPQYKAGEKRLDSFIMGAGEGGQRQIQESKGIADQDANDWTAMLDAINQGIGAGKGTTEQTAQNVRSVFNTQGQDAFDKVNGVDLTGVNATRTREYEDLAGQLQSAKFKDRDAAYRKLGLNYETGEYLRGLGVPLQTLINKAGALGYGDLVDKATQDRFSALDRLGESVGSDLGNFDFTKTGAGTSGYNGSDRLGAAKGVADLLATNKDKLALKDVQNESNYNDIIRALKGQGGGFGSDYKTFLKGIGVDQDIIDMGGLFGLDDAALGRIINKAGPATLTDVVDQSKWGSLFSSLGLAAPKQNKNTVNNEALREYLKEYSRGINDILANGIPDPNAVTYRG